MEKQDKSFAKSSTSNTWKSLIDKHKDIDVSNQRDSEKTSFGYQINLQSLFGYQTLNALDGYNNKYQVRLHLYDIFCRRFVGQTWRSPQLTPEENNVHKSQININKLVYFHTSISDASLLLVIEIVILQTPKDPLPGQPVVNKERTLGWSVFRLFKNIQQLTDISVVSDVVRKLDVYHGSPRALMYMDDPVESNPNIKLVMGCQLSLIFHKHITFNNCIHLIPENMMVGSNEKVPGMSENFSMQGKVKDYYLKAKVLKSCDGYIDKLSINFGVTVDKFEDELCRLVNLDRLKRHNIPEDGKNVTVSARRLMVGVHNGYCYVQTPQFVHVEPEAVIGGPRMGSFGRGKKSVANLLPSNCLVLRSRIQLREMIPDSMVAVVLQLEYVLELPVGGQTNIRGSMSSVRSQSTTVMVRWAWWSPYASNKIPDQPVTVTLNGSVLDNPGLYYFYKVFKNTDGVEKKGVIKFRYLTSDEPLPNNTSVDEESYMVHRQSVVSSAVEREEASVQEGPSQGGYTEVDAPYEVGITHLEMAGEYPPVHAPPIIPVAHGTPRLTRAVYARLYTAGFPEILDRNGAPPEVLDASDTSFRCNLEKSYTDPLQTNEICIQFLAFTKPLQGPSEPPPPTINTIFFSFQFYRFRGVTTQRLSLSGKRDSHGSHDNAPCILRKIEAGEVLDEGQPGLEVKYHVDPMHMKDGENNSFLNYLASHNLHIDVWDGNSLLLLGSLSLPLKHLVRGGISAVCVNHELEVILSEHSDVAPTFTGDLTTGGSVRPLGVSKCHRGKLHLRLGNVGYHSQRKMSAAWQRRPLVVADLTGCSFSGGSLSSAFQESNKVRRSRCKARKMVESNRELAELMLINTKQDDADDSGKENMSDPGKDADKKRKIARMQAIRSMEEQDGERPSIGQRALLNKQEKALKERDLRTISSYRDRLKPEHIMEMLMLSITTKHTIRPTLGVAEFIELQLKNPFLNEQTISIECDSPELRVVTDTREWRYFKGLAGLHTPAEENMFNFSSGTSLPQVFLRPKETVYIPFRYQGYEADHTVTTQGPGHFHKTTPTSLQPIKDQHNHGTIKPKVVKAILRTADGRPLSVLHIVVDPQPHVVDQTFRFYNPEQTFLKKCIRLPPYNLSTTEEQFHVVCSDTEVVCQARSLSRDEPREIFIKAPCGDSPSVRKFYLSIYNDPFLAVPVQTWQLYIHSLQRIDVNSVLGQTSRFSLVLRGTQTARMVQCFVSHPQEMQLSPDTAFLLSPNGLCEIHCGVRTTSPYPSNKYMYVNVVDTEYHQLLRTWLVAVKTREPMISKEFDIELPRSGGKGNNKMISYTNPYSTRKKFVLMTSRSDLLHFRDVTMELGAGEKTTIGLRFASGVTQHGRFPVHIFINDEDDKNEETFLVNVTYV